MARSQKKITQQQIALKAGVSQSAVSAILSGSMALNVSAETRESVLAISEKLGYRARSPVVKNANASPGRSSVLLVRKEYAIPSEDWVGTAYETYFGRILTASGRHLQNYGVGLSVFQLGDPKVLTQWLADSDVCGVLWRASEKDSALLHWVASRFPTVLLNHEWRSSVPFDSVRVDQEANILLAAEHLWSLGHRRIAVFGHVPGSPMFRRRMDAYHQFVSERNLRNYGEFQKISDVQEVPPLEKVAAIIKVWKSLGTEAPTALITGDVFALPLIHAARLAGIAIPQDLSVVGIDNTEACSLVHPPLTSVEEPLDELCRVAVDLLMRRKTDPTAPSQSVQIAPRLILRESVQRPAVPAKLSLSSQ
jgi:LacI family transcriptional regulator